MKLQKCIILIVMLCVTIIRAQDQFKLNGTVKNQADFKVFGLICELVENGYADTTDSSGVFNVTGDATAVAYMIKKEVPAPQFKGSQISIPVTAGGQRVSIEVFNVKGSKVATVFNRALPAGVHTIPVGNYLSTVSQSVLVAVVTCGSDRSKFRIVKAGSHNLMTQKISGGVSGMNQATAEATKTLPVLDSLRFKRCLEIEGQQEELIEYTIPVTELEQEFKVTLDLIPYEAIEWGKTQEGRSNETVGKELGKPGSGIYPYEFQTYYNGAWCSEFYCYCMRIGGCPLGDDGGSTTRPNWLKLGWNILISWFESNAQYVKKSEISSLNFKPNPGDFIQLSEHTAMVRYIASNNDVYCLDGNWGDKVVLVNRGNYKTFSSLNGYGRRSGITGNSFEIMK